MTNKKKGGRVVQTPLVLPINAFEWGHIDGTPPLLAYYYIIIIIDVLGGDFPDMRLS